MTLRPLTLGTLLFATACTILLSGEPSLDQLPKGYVDKEALPNSIEIVPEAPLPGSARQKMDDAIAAAAVKLNKTARFELAAKDADLFFPQAPNSFACALGAVISEEKTPRLYHLLLRALVDGGLSTYKAKIKYNRMRPFTINNAPICTPEDEKILRHDGSYPSGHTALGWTWALILAELAPDKADAILARGLAYGESRIICNVHWNSDVVAGRIMGSSTFARMHNSPEFIADMKAAKAELAAAPAPKREECRKEAAALAVELY
jgi:acid phosphatase (class A)